MRIALNLADMACDSVVVNLLTGEHREDAHATRNPQRLVPVLDIDGERFTQSLAIRWGASHERCVRINAVAEACPAHPAFAAAHRDCTPDA